MTDINEIIGRAAAEMLAIGGAKIEDSFASLADIGAAVVKALAAAGYEISRKEPDRPELPVIREYEDGCTIRAKLGDNEYHVDFEIWGGIGENHDMEVRGSVKWDGCMNWESSPTAMYHFCSPSDAERLTALFKDVWEEGRKLMPRADEHYGQ